MPFLPSINWFLIYFCNSLLLFCCCSDRAKVDETWLSDEKYEDDVFNRLVIASVDTLAVDSDRVLEMVGLNWVKFLMCKGYDQVLKTLGKTLSEFISNLDFMHGAYMKTMYPRMTEPSFRADSSEDGSLIVHYLSERRRLHMMVSGIIKGVARIIFNENIAMKVIDFKKEIHRGVQIDHWVYHVSFLETNLSPVSVQDTLSLEEDLLQPIIFAASSSSNIQQMPDPNRKTNPVSDPNFVVKTPGQLWIDPTTFCKAFPYHVVFNKHLMILQCGVQIQRFCPRVTTEGVVLNDFLSIDHPHIDMTIDYIKQFPSSIFILDFKRNELAEDLKDKPMTSLRGQMIWMEPNENMIFLCSPCLTRLDDLTERGLYLSDIAPHDITRDIILFNQQRIAEVELSKQLERKDAELEILMKVIVEEKRKAETLLHSMLPREVANELREGRHVKAGEFQQVTILFSDIVGFTNICSQCHPIEIVDLLNEMYTQFDHLTNECGIYKVETIGDAYMAVGGLPIESEMHAQRVAQFALQQLRVACNIISPISGKPIQIRVGMHTGPVVAGVVGLKMPRYCLFGDTVNVASRMESNGLPGKIHTSEAVLRAIKYANGIVFATRGYIEIKGKGTMKTYFLEQRSADNGQCTYANNALRHQSNSSTSLPQDTNLSFHEEARSSTDQHNHGSELVSLSSGSSRLEPEEGGLFFEPKPSLSKVCVVL